MSEVKWTPGPWRVISSQVHVVSDNAPGNVVICRTGISGQQGDEPPTTRERWESDAHLIAAAPDLFEALEHVVEVMEDGHQSNAKELARAALAKARGEQQ